MKQPGSMSASLSDCQARRAAETTFDRNVVVVAGAGTGKTTLLVNRLTHALMKEPRPLAITQTVALTYTNKAAAEMKVRLRERLSVLARAVTDPCDASAAGTVSLEDLRSHYGITTDTVVARAAGALHDLEKAQIGTVHSFAAHLLRLYPLEAGVDPAFREDDGLRLEESFRMAWDVWIDRELGRHGTQHHRWRTLLESTTLEEIRRFAFALSSDLVDVDQLFHQVTAAPHQSLLAWIGGLREQADRLLDAYDRPKRRKIEHMLAGAIALMSLMEKEGPDAMEQVDPSIRGWLEKDPGDGLSDWDGEDFSKAVSIVKTARHFLTCNQPYFISLLTLVMPLIASIKASFTASGWVSFDGLLSRARRLLWEHPEVRERIKRDYRAILIDEFQDTDPVQYEILLALAEEPGRSSSAWQDMRLEAGKLFIVGDPKQSIYAFRRADMEAFDRVVEKVLADRGVLHSLTTNFRSDRSVLGPVNDVFDRLFLQPANVRLEADVRRTPSAGETGVILQIVAPRPDDEPFHSAAAARAEAEALAHWLSEDLLIRPGVSAGDVAFLFRKLTQADAYLDALRRYNIPYLIEGEKHFYRRQEVIDLMNLLRVLDHPGDHIALLGLLRSPLGGLTDREISDLRDAGWFSYLDRQPESSWSHARAESVGALYGRLAALHRVIAAVPLNEAIELVFEQLPVLELAATSLHGEQAVANLLKVKQTAASLADRPSLTLNGFIELMVTRVDEQPDEAESPLAEDASDAVQILTIHKAKGLEFPIVVLPGLHQGSGREKTAPPVVYDWSTGSYGLSTGRHQTLAYTRVQEKQAEREKAERRRVFYVAMTRAQDLLLLSGGLTSRSVGETVLTWLEDVGEGGIGSPGTKSIHIGASAVSHRLVHAPTRKWPRRFPTSDENGPQVDQLSLARVWQERTARWHGARGGGWRLTPTALDQQSPEEVALSPRGIGRDVSRLVGVVAHRILEEWDFRLPPSRFIDCIEPTVDRFLSPETDHLRAKAIDALAETFATFGASEPYARLRSADILGREVPFIMPWGDGQVMEGIIDVIYRLDGAIRIADYKTDRTTTLDAPARARSYAQQAAVYREAATRCLGHGDVPFECIFLAAGIRVAL
jgi:ATP-dependent helicase/nuclease subunit A